MAQKGCLVGRRCLAARTLEAHLSGVLRMHAPTAVKQRAVQLQHALVGRTTVASAQLPTPVPTAWQQAFVHSPHLTAGCTTVASTQCAIPSTQTSMGFAMTLSKQRVSAAATPPPRCRLGAIFD